MTLAQNSRHTPCAVTAAMGTAAFVLACGKLGDCGCLLCPGSPAYNRDLVPSAGGGLFCGISSRTLSMSGSMGR